MRRTLVSILVVAFMSFITAMLLLKLLGNFSLTVKPNDSQNTNTKKLNKPTTKSLPQKPNDNFIIKDSEQINPDTIQTNKIENHDFDDEIIKVVGQAQNYLSSTKTKSLETLEFHYLKLTKLYKIKGLSKEANKMLLTNINKVKKEKQKLLAELDETNKVEDIFTIGKDTLKK
jgi:hypothetical protein